MPTAQQQEIFSPEEAERFAALCAGFDSNPSEAEAMGKIRLARRMLPGKTLQDGSALRFFDALELTEIRAALDAQLQPVRPENEEVKKLKEELEAVYRQVTEMAEAAQGQELTIEALRAANVAASGSCGFSSAGPVEVAPACLAGFVAFAGFMGGAALLYEGVVHLAAWLGSF